MILEGIVTTLNPDGSANISPMGPLVDEDMQRFVLRPYRTSRTYANLKRIGEGVLHVTDDVEMIAKTAIGAIDSVPPMVQSEDVEGVILTGACRWYAFKVSSLFDDTERTTIECEIVNDGRIRDFFGFNRAKHAVLEAAILATRTAFLPAAEIQSEMKRLAVIVEKTCGPQERSAFDLLQTHIHAALAAPSSGR